MRAIVFGDICHRIRYQYFGTKKNFCTTHIQKCTKMIAVNTFIAAAKLTNADVLYFVVEMRRDSS